MKAVQNLIHIGLPKCASTTLQNRVFPRQEGFEYLGCTNKTYSDPAIKNLVEQIMFHDSLDYAPVYKKRDKPVLLSHEALSVEGYADRRIIAERLYKLFAPAKIMVVVRSQLTLLPSMYLNHMRGSGECVISFEQWLTNNYGGPRFADRFRVGLDYYKLIKSYEDVFGKKNIHVQLFELYKDELPSADNQRMSKRHLAVMRMQSQINLAQLGRKLLPFSVYQPIRNLVVGGKRVNVEFSKEWLRRITDLCIPGNINLESYLGLPLGKYGYPGV